MSLEGREHSDDPKVIERAHKVMTGKEIISVAAFDEHGRHVDR
jgi:hypothetical protein